MKIRITAVRLTACIAAAVGAIVPAIASAASNDSYSVLMSATPGPEAIVTLLVGMGFVLMGVNRQDA